MTGAEKLEKVGNRWRKIEDRLLGGFKVWRRIPLPALTSQSINFLLGIFVQRFAAWGLRRGCQRWTEIVRLPWQNPTVGVSNSDTAASLEAECDIFSEFKDQIIRDSWRPISQCIDIPTDFPTESIIYGRRSSGVHRTDFAH